MNRLQKHLILGLVQALTLYLTKPPLQVNRLQEHFILGLVQALGLYLTKPLQVNRLQEHLDQLRETAEEEVATLSMKLKTLERERRDAVARLESELAEQQASC